MAILTFYTLLFLVALPLGEVSRISFGLHVSFSLLDVLVFLGSIMWLGSRLVKRDLAFSLYEKVFIATVGVFALSLILNALRLSFLQTVTSGLYIVRWACYGLLLLMANRTSQTIQKKLQIILLAGGTLTLFGGYVQYFLYPSLRNLIYFGWDEHFYRMFGTFFDPNFFGLFLVLFLLFVLSLLFRIRVEKQKYYFVGLFLLSCATGMGIILTYSRTALVALFVGIIILFWNKHIWKLFVVLFGIAVVIGIFSIVSNRVRLSANTLAMNSLFRSTSAGARIGSAKDAITIFMDSPIFGVGFNAYRYSMYQHNFQPGSSVQEDHGASGADSSVLLVLATSGIVGLTVFLTFWIVLGKSLWKNKNKVGIATLIVFFVGSFFVNGLFYPLLLTWVWTILGITIGDER